MAEQKSVWCWLGRVGFADTAALQEDLRREVIAGGRETLLLLEHDAVITMGRSAEPANVLVDDVELARRGVALHRASRGGDVTYHGPGQLVGYPIVRLRGGVRAHVEAMALAIAEVLRELGLDAVYRSAAPGLWVGEAKICAFGINVHRRVTVHGFALNLSTDLDAFKLIVPCGISGCAVTSLRALTGEAPSPQALAPRIAAALGGRLGIPFEADEPAACVSIAMPLGTTRMESA
jgi:lipoyl(octanoyl) transferase